MASTYLNNEDEILLRVAEGDEKAFAVIVDHYTDIIYPHLLSFIKNAEKAEEITQDIFLRIWNNRKKLAGIENFAGYVYVITRNRAKTAFKEQLASRTTELVDPLNDILADPEAVSLEVKELQRVLQQAIDNLPPRRKEVFLLSRVENLTYDQIAAQLNISRSAVRQHIVEALVFLRSYLKEKLGIIVSHSGWLLLICDLFV
ncbi:RNA polymerase sigma factor [Niabella sp. CJ426]|uniref:RNA polymerase sigma factor n=1 Tax=Niabella sp. CJ426 TaxID=3393740 RepID=UPI003D043339